jgi:hypothetical protein
MNDIYEGVLQTVNETVENLMMKDSSLLLLRSTKKEKSQQSPLLKMVYTYSHDKVSQKLDLSLHTIMKEDGVKRDFNTRTVQHGYTLPSSSASYSAINLTDIIRFMDINLLNNDPEMRSTLQTLSLELNKERLAFNKSNTIMMTMSNIHKEQITSIFEACSIESSHSRWYYISLLAIINAYFYNNTSSFSYIASSTSEEGGVGEKLLTSVGSDLFIFEFFMTLLSQSTLFMNFGHRFHELKLYSHAIKAYNQSIEVLDFMVKVYEKSLNNNNDGGGNGNNSSSSADYDITRKFLYIPSPSFISSSSSSPHSLPPKQSNQSLKTSIVQKELTSMMDSYFGGKEAWSMLKELVYAQRNEIFYDYKLSKLNMDNDCNYKLMKGIIHSNTLLDINPVDYVEVFQLSKSILSHYEEGWRLLQTTLHARYKTRLYYFVLFMKHYWFCKHHFFIAVFDSYLYDKQYDTTLGGSITAPLHHDLVDGIIYAQHALTRIIQLIAVHNEFLEHNLFLMTNIDGGGGGVNNAMKDTIVSNIIADTILNSYLELSNNIVILRDYLYHIVIELHGKQSLDFYKDLNYFEPISIPPKQSLPLDAKLFEIFNRKLNSSQHILQKLADLSELYYNKSGNMKSKKKKKKMMMTVSSTTTNNRAMINDPKTIRIMNNSAKNATAQERLEWINYMITKVDLRTMTIFIDANDTNLIIREQENVAKVINTNHQYL